MKPVMTMEQLTNTDTVVRIAETPVVQSGAEQHQRPVDIHGQLWHLFISLALPGRGRWRLWWWTALL